MNCRISKKFASKRSTNHSQVLPGGIFGDALPFAAPGLVLPGAESLFRPFCCSVERMVTFSLEALALSSARLDQRMSFRGRALRLGVRHGRARRIVWQHG